MEKEVRKILEAKIIAKIKTLKEDILELRELTKPISPENAIGRISRMDAINNKSVNEASLRHSEIKLKNLQIALKEINAAEFGICRKCKKDIAAGRMLVMPESRLCMNCLRRA